MVGFADEACDRLDQDLLILASGERTRPLLKRLQQYKEFVNNPATQHTEFAKKYAERIMQTVSTSRTGPVTYIPGEEARGDELRSFSDKPLLSGPLMCKLCDANFYQR